MKPPLIFTGTIIAGHGRGKKLSFPTINLKVPLSDQPKKGVYIVQTTLRQTSKKPEGSRIYGLMHVGPRPTYQETDPSIEIHLLDFNEHVTDKKITISIFGRLRAIKKFNSPEALKKQIHKDMMKAQLRLKSLHAQFSKKTFSASSSHSIILP